MDDVVATTLLDFSPDLPDRDLKKPMLFLLRSSVVCVLVLALYFLDIVSDE